MGNFLKTAAAMLQNKYLRRGLLGSMALWLALMAAGWLLLPSYVERVAVGQVQQQIGRKLEIAELSFSPFTLALTANGVTLYEADRRTPAVTLRQLVLNLSLSSLFRQALVIDEVRVQSPVLHIVRDGAAVHSHYNFSDILQRIAAMPGSEAPFRFALANLQLADGAIRFDDLVVGKHIEIEALQAGLPFLSNFPAEINSYVQPSVSARINGSSFGLKGRARPFGAAQEAALAIDLEQLDLAHYVAYAPVALPLQIQKALLSTRLDLIFSRKKRQAELLLAGDLRLQDVALQDRRGAPLLKLGNLQASVGRFNVMNGAADIAKLQIAAPELWLDIDSQGKLNWASLAAGSAARPAKAESKTPSEPAWPSIALAELALQQGRVHVRDASHAVPAAEVTLDKITLDARHLSTAADAKAAPLRLSLQGAQQERLEFEGAVHPLAAAANGKLSLKALPLNAYQPFLNRSLAADLAGNLSLDTQIRLQPGQLKLDGLALQLDGFRLKPKARKGSGGEGGLSLNSLKLEQLSLDSESRSIKAANLQLEGLNGDLRRDAGAVLNVQKWLAPTAVSRQAGQAAQSSPAWKLALDHLGVQGATFAFTDQAVAPAVTLTADKLSLSADSLSSDWSEALTLSLQANINRKGRLSLSGEATPQLKNILLNLTAQGLPVASLHPYFSRHLNVSLTRGLASARGRLNLGGVLGPQPQVAYDGMLSLDDFHILENGASEDFLEWKNIALDGVHARFGGSRPLLEMKKLALNDFYARAILSDKGRLNLQNILAGQTAPVVDAAASAAPTAGAGHRAGTAAPLAIRIGQTTLRGGNINFTDNFIKPNYSANLTGVSGTVGALASDLPQAATLELNGKIDKDAPLLISGTLNPLSSPVFLDIKGSAAGIELTRLTPYAAKYAGYAIDKGKLSVQVAYRIENQQLQADNEIRLDQLTFGERIESPDATKLPVQLALALLRDNDGRIALNLPISGSLSDPQFSVGDIVLRVFVNLVSKAVTAPFALLGSLSGGGEELAYAEFAPGQAVLTPAAGARLDKLATALDNRRGLRLDIIGRVEPVSDSEGLRREMLQRKLLQLKWENARKQDPDIRFGQIVLSEQEREKYVQAAYRQGKFGKPRNLIGIAKTLPGAEAEKMLLANTVLTPDALRLLAQKRADAVRDYLEQQAGIGKERLFLIAPKLNADGIQDKGAANRVDFSLK